MYGRGLTTHGPNLRAHGPEDSLTVLVEEGKPPGDFPVQKFSPRGGRTTKTMGSGTPGAVEGRGSMQSAVKAQGPSSHPSPRCGHSGS